MFVFENPPALPALPFITHLALNLRFTRQERDAIRAAETSDPDVSDALFLMRQARYIDLSHPHTRAAIQMLEDKQLLSSGRALQVLDAPIQQVEMPPLN